MSSSRTIYLKTIVERIQVHKERQCGNAWIRLTSLGLRIRKIKYFVVDSQCYRECWLCWWSQGPHPGARGNNPSVHIHKRSVCKTGSNRKWASEHLTGCEASIALVVVDYLGLQAVDPLEASKTQTERRARRATIICTAGMKTPWLGENQPPPSCSALRCKYLYGSPWLSSLKPNWLTHSRWYGDPPLSPAQYNAFIAKPASSGS